MCGLAGLFSPRGETDAALTALTESMCDRIVHRGPDDSGTWTDAASGIALGFRRLSIIDLSPLGHQPMASASGRYRITFNGEVFNFAELREELHRAGASFRGHSDTEVILAAFEAWGIDRAVTRFVGMFAMAVWDTQERALTLIRDRLGIKPLHVAQLPDGIAFASELKSLAVLPGFTRDVDPDALALYLRYLYVPAPLSIYRGVRKLPAGHLLTIRDPRAPLPASRPFWSLDEVVRRGRANLFTGTAEEAAAELDRQLGAAVRLRMVADVPLGALLSGGIDSTVVVAMMQEASARPVRTFTIGFEEAEYDEAPHARAVAAHLGTAHEELRVTGRDALALVPRLPEMFDEPLADASQLPTFLVSELARRSVTVALSGDGGDELFAGYNRYAYGMRVLPRFGALPRPVRRLAAVGTRALGPGTWDRLYAAVPGGRHRLVGEKLHKIGHLLSADGEAAMYRSLLSAWQEPGAVLRHATPTLDPSHAIFGRGSPPALLARMMLADQSVYLPDDLLAKVDRASMAVSLEVRVPILDHRVVEFSWTLPDHYKLRDGVTKWPLRQVAYRRVPAALLERPKMGFTVPIDAWLRGPLRPWAEDLLTDVDAVAQLRGDGVRDAWRAFLARRASSGNAMWALLVFLDWRRHWRAA